MKINKIIEKMELLFLLFFFYSPICGLNLFGGNPAKMVVGIILVPIWGMLFWESSFFKSKKKECFSVKEDLSITEAKNMFLLYELKNTCAEIRNPETKKAVKNVYYILSEIYTIAQDKSDKRKIESSKMTYYLELTVRVINMELDMQKYDKAINSEEGIFVHEEVLKTLDSLAMVFEKMLSDMFEDYRKEIGLEQDVLKTKMKLDGFS